MKINNVSPHPFPKILIIGDSFGYSNGGGITMTNLFKGWPKDSIAVVTTKIETSGLNSCILYYHLGYAEDKRSWPFYYFQPKYRSGPVVFDNNTIPQDIVSQQPHPSKYNRRFKNLILGLCQFLGVSFLQNKLNVSPSFLQWIYEYKPDLIYTQLANYELIKFVQEINKLTKIPLAIHIMDDWPVSLNKPGILYYYWKYKLDHEFRKLLAQSSIFLSICDAMSQEYKKRYQKPFKAFHNPIDTDQWLPFSKQNWNTNGPFRIIYTGRIGTANGNAVVEISKVIHKLHEQGENVELDIYSPDAKSPKAKQIHKLKGVRILDPVPYMFMPSLLPKYDLAVLPLDFTREGIRFAKFSMPTKTSEYMISGTPVMIFADERTALCRYASAAHWAIVVTQNKNTALMESIKKIMCDEKLRQQLGQTARNLAIKNENAQTVVLNFRNTLSSILKKIKTPEYV